ncbi:MAG: M61 family metallopeptidase [Sphingobacteriaceae bacterium]
MDTSNSHAKTAPVINYEISFPEAQAHYADVTMILTGLNENTVTVKMPVWAPGSYLIREFSKNVEGFGAESNGKKLSFEKQTKNSWRIITGSASSVKISYRVYAFEISVRTSFIDASHAFLSTTGIFLYPEGLLKEPSTIKIKPYKNWKSVSSGLESKGDPFTLYAPNFDVLFDSPIEVGNQDVFTFNASGVAHEVAMVGGGNYDQSRLKKDMARIVEEETAVFGENPNKRYVFIVHHYLTGGGGLEHFNSTVLGASRNQYSNEVGYKNFLGLVAHEYFHLWNVKRLRPKALGPFNYDQENYTTELWIAEGLTAYYDNQMVHRAGFFTPEKYLDELLKTINTVENQPGNKIQTLTEASFDAWVKLYRPNENTKNSGISYYDKGSLMGMLLDLEIIHSSKGTKSLDDVMRYMYREYYLKDNRGYTAAEFKQAVEKITGKSFDEFYGNYVNGLSPVDYNLYFGYAGLQLADEYAGRNEPELGIVTAMKDGKLLVSNVLRNSAAWIDGINVNDELVSIDGIRITELNKILREKKTGDLIQVTVSRDGQMIALPVTLLKSTQVKYTLQKTAEKTVAQLNVLKKWLALSNKDFNLR